jgi:hypothetical protein
MPATVVSFPPQPVSFRRICCWCHSDLGQLAHPIEHDSYAICGPCQYRYFPHLFEDDVVEQRTAEVLQERAVGA